MAALDFGGRVVVVTGVGRAGQIGHAVAEGFGRCGARLVVVDRNAVGVTGLAKRLAESGLAVRAAAGDLTEPDVAENIVETALEQFGRLDVVVNVAGGFTGAGPMVEVPVEALDQALRINATTTYVVSRAAARHMQQQRSGSIVNFASVAALNARPNIAAYSAAKAGVAAITRALALELRDSGVRVNAVAPGLVRTADNLAEVDDPDAVWVEIADVVNAVLFLASDLAAGITGHVLPVSRGEL